MPGEKELLLFARFAPRTRNVPELTHRLRRVALPGSVGSLCAPGCHRVQESVQEDPSESRHTEHRVEMTGRFCYPPFRDFYDSAQHSRVGGRKRKRSVKDDFSSHTCPWAGGSFRPVAIPETVSGCPASVLKLFSSNLA